MTSTIEPTEEQRMAARDACQNLNGSLYSNIARLLAEREHKLREDNDRAWQDINNARGEAHLAEVETRRVQADLDAARADNAFLRNLFACIATECETGEPDPLTVSLHVRNAVLNSRADARVAEKERDAARADYATVVRDAYAQKAEFGAASSKLRAEVATLNANNDQLVRALEEGGFCYPTSNAPRFIVHNREESSGDWYDPAMRRIMHMDPAKAFAMADDLDAARARIAELEASIVTFHGAWKGAEADCNAQVKRVVELELLLGKWCAAEVMCDVPERRKLLDETGSMLLAKKVGV